MGDSAKAREDVADVHALVAHVLEPFLVDVIDAGQLVGPDITELAAGGVDDAEIDEAAEAALEVGEDRIQAVETGEHLEAVVLNDEVESRHPLDE